MSRQRPNTPDSDGWVHVVWVDNCRPDEAGEPICPYCGVLFQDCPCPGPLEENWEYMRGADGVPFRARRVEPVDVPEDLF